MVRLARRERLIRKYYPRPQTYQEWAHMAMFTTARPDDRTEFAKIRELIREGKLPNPGPERGRAENNQQKEQET
jgi:hypothetical protein